VSSVAISAGNSYCNNAVVTTVDTERMYTVGYTVLYRCMCMCVHRKCPTGEGIFMFDTKDADAIFEQVQRATRAQSRRPTDSVSGGVTIINHFSD